jgi:glycosyltransferase involved in cell wall biosynthesis
MIPYGMDITTDAEAAALEKFGLEPHSYALVIARPEPENSILEIVTAFSQRLRGYRLVLVGTYDTASYPYHARVVAAAGSEVIFLGPIYHKKTVAALRHYCRLYIHGHQVGGTNPSLLESMAAGAPVLVHDNQFNRWVVGNSAHFFKDIDECSERLDRMLPDSPLLSSLGRAGQKRCEQEFSPERVLSEYEELLNVWWVRDLTLRPQV